MNKELDKKDILKIIEDAFDNNINATANESVLGMEVYIEGKEDFLKEIKEKLNY